MRAALTKLAQQIREEFDEAVGLRVTGNEAARFFGLDVETCERALVQLHEIGFLAKDLDGRYWRVKG
jgi:DNA-binding IclR family transcriptional regulator